MTFHSMMTEESRARLRKWHPDKKTDDAIAKQMLEFDRSQRDHYLLMLVIALVFGGLVLRLVVAFLKVLA